MVLTRRQGKIASNLQELLRQILRRCVVQFFDRDVTFGLTSYIRLVSLVLHLVSSRQLDVRRRGMCYLGPD